MSPEIVFIGNAPIDIIMHVPDDILDRYGFIKGKAHEVNSKQAGELSSLEYLKSEIPGGAGANVAAVFNAIGGIAGFIGKIGLDKYGRGFIHGFEKFGVQFRTPADRDLPNGRIFTLITPDKERTFAADFAASNKITTADVDHDEETIAQAKAIYLDGYTLKHDHGRAVFHRAIEIAKKNNTIVAMSLADVSVVEDYRYEIGIFMEDADIIFMNRAESIILANGEVLDDYLAMLARTKKDKIFVVTLGENGSAVVANGEVIHIKAPLQRSEIIDLNGAGDHYAAGFLKAYLENPNDLERAAKHGSAMASVALVTEGARPIAYHNPEKVVQKFYSPIQGL